VLQLVDVIENGYWHARDLNFLMTGTFHKLEWLRIVGDLTFIVVGVVPMAYATIRSFVVRDLKRTA